MSEYVINVLGWMSVFGLFTVAMLIIAICIWLATPVVFTFVIAREQRHGQILELMDKQIELEKTTHASAVLSNRLMESTGSEQATVPTEQAAPAKEVPDVPAPPA